MTSACLSTLLAVGSCCLLSVNAEIEISQEKKIVKKDISKQGTDLKKKVLDWFKKYWKECAVGTAGTAALVTIVTLACKNAQKGKNSLLKEDSNRDVNINRDNKKGNKSSLKLELQPDVKPEDLLREADKLQQQATLLKQQENNEKWDEFVNKSTPEKVIETAFKPMQRVYSGVNGEWGLRVSLRLLDTSKGVKLGEESSEYSKKLSDFQEMCSNIGNGRIKATFMNGEDDVNSRMNTIGRVKECKDLIRKAFSREGVEVLIRQYPGFLDDVMKHSRHYKDSLLGLKKGSQVNTDNVHRFFKLALELLEREYFND